MSFVTTYTLRSCQSDLNAIIKQAAARKLVLLLTIINFIILIILIIAIILLLLLFVFSIFFLFVRACVHLNVLLYLIFAHLRLGCDDSFANLWLQSDKVEDGLPVQYGGSDAVCSPSLVHSSFCFCFCFPGLCTAFEGVQRCRSSYAMLPAQCIEELRGGNLALTQ